MPERLNPEAKLQADIDNLKDAAPYRERFETEEARQLSQALDILSRLRLATFDDASGVGYNKLRDATLYLDSLLKKHLDSKE